MFLDQYKKIHCVGIGGIGISGIAKFLLANGKSVTGSDAVASDITKDLEQRGVPVFLGHDASHVPDDVDLVVYTEAAPEENPERAAARDKGIRQLGHFDFLGELSKEYRTICVSGTNGKSTTTAMTGLIFEEAGLDPTVFVGSLVPGWKDGNVRIGKSDILIIEGDEYKQKMVKLFPETTVITNIEEDHLDVYRNLAHIIDTFRELAQKTAGKVFANAEDENCRQFASEIDAMYGSGPLDALRAENRKVGDGEQTFEVVDMRVRSTHLFEVTDMQYEGERLGSLTLKLPGLFNMMNALGATMAALEYGIAFKYIARALSSFTGIWRRFERVGEYNGAVIISDYGHHPTAIRGTIAAAHEFFPDHRIVLLFEPHQHSRTKELFHEFVKSFHDADVVVLSEIYAVKGRMAEADEVSSRDLAREVEKHMMAHHPRLKNVVYAENLEKAEQEIRMNVKAGDVVIIMGAGDVDQVARRLAG